MTKSILIIDPVVRVLVDQFRQWGWQVSHTTDARSWQRCEGIVLRGSTLDVNMLAKAKRLEFVARAGAGIDNIAQEACCARKIAIFNAPEASANSVAEHTVGMMLALLHRIAKAGWESKQYLWRREDNRGTELKHKRVGIIGYGHMGQATASLLAAFGCTVLVYDVVKKDITHDAVQQVSLARLHEEADIVSMHVPLTSKTAGMVNKSFLSAFAKKIFFVNTSRGSVVETADLCWALDEGRVVGVALDVLTHEPMVLGQSKALDRLMRRPQVIVTPHVAGWSVESHKGIAEVLIEKIRAFYGLP